MATARCLARVLTSVCQSSVCSPAAEWPQLLHVSFVGAAEASSNVTALGCSSAIGPHLNAVSHPYAFQHVPLPPCEGWRGEEGSKRKEKLYNRIPTSHSPPNTYYYYIYVELNRGGNDTEMAAMEICYFLYQTCQFEELRRLKLPNTPGGGSESPSAADSQVCQRDSSVIGG